MVGLLQLFRKTQKVKSEDAEGLERRYIAARDILPPWSDLAGAPGYNSQCLPILGDQYGVLSALDFGLPYSEVERDMFCKERLLDSDTWRGAKCCKYFRKIKAS
jgi:hypothetical protein